MLFRSGNLYLRAPQIRLEQQLGAGLELRAGIVTPLAGDFGAEYVFAPGPGAGERSRTPALQARLGYQRAADEDRRIRVGVSGHFGRQRNAAGTTDQWASAIDWNLQARAGGPRGRGVHRRGSGGLWRRARTIGALGRRLCRSAVRPAAGCRSTAAADWIAWRDRDRGLVPLRSNQTWFGNGIVTLTPELATSLEYRRLETETRSGAERTNHHVNLTFAFSF